MYKNNFELCHKISLQSPDPDRKVGCVITDNKNIVLSCGYNDFPNGVNILKERVTRPQKYHWIEHAERNAIYNAVKNGIKLNNSTMYINCFPCVNCSRAIIQSGITNVVTLKPNLNDSKWGKDFAVSLEMLKESEINIDFIDEKSETKI